jgi:hypothetical protein
MPCLDQSEEIRLTVQEFVDAISSGSGTRSYSSTRPFRLWI